MKFNIPKVIKPLNLGGYDDAVQEHILQVWVNPNRAIENEFYAISGRLQEQTKRYDDLLPQYKDADEAKIAELNAEMDQLTEGTRAVNDEFFQWYSNILSQHSDKDTHMTAEDLRWIAGEDPALWKFIANGVQDLISIHRERTSKN